LFKLLERLSCLITIDTTYPYTTAVRLTTRYWKKKKKKKKKKKRKKKTSPTDLLMMTMVKIKYLYNVL